MAAAFTFFLVAAGVSMLLVTGALLIANPYKGRDILSFTVCSLDQVHCSLVSIINGLEGVALAIPFAIFLLLVLFFTGLRKGTKW